MKTFVTFVEIERRKRGLTQVELSKLVGMSPSRISLIENGQIAAKPDDIARLTQTLGIKKLF